MFRRSQWSLAAGIVVLQLVLAGCPAPAPTPKAVDTSTVKQVVGAAGGTLEHPAGAKLVVPPGVLASDVELSITGAAAPSTSQAGAPAVGQAFVLGPDGQQFGAPLTIEVPVDVALMQQLEAGPEELRLRLAPQSTMAFVELATTADVARQLLTAQLTHFSIIVPVASTNPFSFSTSGLPAASVGVPYQGALVVSGGTGPYVFSVVAGDLPPGLVMSELGLLSGTPTSGGTFTFTARVTDAAGAAADAVVSLDVAGQGQCNTLVNAAGLVAELRQADAAPTPSGGTFTPGTWVRAATVIHTGVGGATGATGRQVRQTLRITEVGGTFRFDNVYAEAAGAADISGGSAAFSGTQLTLSFTCPMTGTRVLGYSASSKVFSLFEQVTEGLREITYVPEGTGSSDAGTPADAGTPTDAGTQVCTAPLAVGAVVAEQYAGATGPQAGGGTIADGDYELISDSLYGDDGGAAGPTGNQRQQTARFAGSTVTSTIVDGSGTAAYGFTIQYAGPTFTLTQTCPASSSMLNFAYTVTGDQLLLMRGSPRGTEVSLYQRVGTAGDGGTTTDAGASSDGGVDAGAAEVIGSGFTDLVDLAYDSTQAMLYTLGNGTVNRCDTAACGGTGTGTVVANVYASSVAATNGTLFVTTDFRNVKTCDATACSLSLFADVGANSYPAHLALANGRVYWMSEAGAARRIQACPVSGCGAGITTVYSGAELDGVPVSGVSVDAAAVYVASFTGGLWRIPLGSPDAASGPATSLASSAYGTGGLMVDGTVLGWAEANDNRVMACQLPACSSTMTILTGLVTPVGLASDATWVYGADRGTPNGSGGYLTGTARVWRWLKQ